MQHIVDPRQMVLADPYEHVFSPVAHKRVRAGWHGVFRHVILELLPAEALARSFSDELGRPTKELYSMAGLVFIMQFNNWTTEQAADAYMFDTAIQYALNLSPGAQSMSPRTLERYLKLVREDGLAGQIMDTVCRGLTNCGDTQRDKAARSQLRQQVAEDMYALIVRFSDDKLHNTRTASPPPTSTPRTAGFVHSVPAAP